MKACIGRRDIGLAPQLPLIGAGGADLQPISPQIGTGTMAGFSYHGTFPFESNTRGDERVGRGTVLAPETTGDTHVTCIEPVERVGTSSWKTIPVMPWSLDRATIDFSSSVPVFLQAAGQVAIPTVVTTAGIGATVLLGAPMVAEAVTARIAGLVGFIRAAQTFDQQVMQSIPQGGGALPLGRSWELTFGNLGNSLKYDFEWVRATSQRLKDGRILVQEDTFSTLELVQRLRLEWFRSFLKLPEWPVLESSVFAKEWAAHAFAQRSLTEGFRLAARPRDSLAEGMVALGELLVAAGAVSFLAAPYGLDKLKASLPYAVKLPQPADNSPKIRILPRDPPRDTASGS